MDRSREDLNLIWDRFEMHLGSLRRFQMRFKSMHFKSFRRFQMHFKSLHRFQIGGTIPGSSHFRVFFFAMEFCAPTPVLIDSSIGTMYTSEPNPDVQCTSPLISRSPRPNPAPSIATIGSMPDAPPMRLPRVVRFGPTPPLPVSEALGPCLLVKISNMYIGRSTNCRYIQKRPKPSPIEAQEGRIFSQSCAASLKPCTQCLARNTNLMLESIAQGMGSPKLHRNLPCHQNTHIGHGLF
ncbi:BQ5605_C022g09576 [Microbotryum silenes-dioicae]|uniref:BQ5605_C022g09576 protein n=1 Tax=Microbotryum silenes-dioicae TaxID=796604 RepID=A0A2X0PLF8_9BASI|nr:BQ5605_C022g09576 [Microbotryum silenes-dioicae]